MGGQADRTGVSRAVEAAVEAAKRGDVIAARQLLALADQLAAEALARETARANRLGRLRVPRIPGLPRR
ncbi:hypothetical protein ABZ412_33825 [Nocardia sp. NPDC005746]|uniref:hypothetical protein n=1 Tax=unclassified Nocardia TaxID=2637762 RepID=UPI0033E4D0DB